MNAPQIGLSRDLNAHKDPIMESSSQKKLQLFQVKITPENTTSLHKSITVPPKAIFVYAARERKDIQKLLFEQGQNIAIEDISLISADQFGKKEQFMSQRAIMKAEHLDEPAKAFSMAA